MRGTGIDNGAARIGSRFIPARAGNSMPRRSSTVIAAVHPRTCGEQYWKDGQSYHIYGSSPHVRGTVHAYEHPLLAVRFIPARAGNRPSPKTLFRSGAVHPRTCGEQTSRRVLMRTAIGSSPHVRGTVCRALSPLSSPRFIPARAGNRK